MREDIEKAFAEALARPNGAVGRGPHRYYVEIHPEQLRGFVELVSHPWVDAVSRAVLGPDYRVVEVGFDHVTSNRFRHGTKFLRWRPDKTPRQCDFDQMS